MDRPSDIGDLAWSNTLQRLTGEVTHDVADEFRQRRLGQPVPDFTPLSPDEVAGPVDVQTWMVRGLWALGSHGSMAGPKKSLKTTFPDAMAIGIACGKPVLDEWEVAERGPVLIYAGEGSVEWRKKSLQRLANDLYNVKIGTGEDQAQIHVVPVSYPFNTSEFRLGLAKNMRDINPVMVTLDSTYNYHPRGINTADMYDRGPLFAELSALVRDCDPLTSLVLIDHMRQNASLDLDAINWPAWASGLTRGSCASSTKATPRQAPSRLTWRLRLGVGVGGARPLTGTWASSTLRQTTGRRRLVLRSRTWTGAVGRAAVSRRSTPGSSRRSALMSGC
jgi:hypothetical protein